MHASFSTVFSLFFFFLPLCFILFSSLILFFFFFSYSPLRGFLLLFMATSLPFTLLDSMGYLPFVPKASSTIFSFLWAFLEDYPLTRRLPGHYLCSKCACCTTFIPEQKTLFCFSPSPSLSYLHPFLLHCLIPWDFSLLSLRLHQPFLVSCGHFSRITH